MMKMMYRAIAIALACATVGRAELDLDEIFGGAGADKKEPAKTIAVPKPDDRTGTDGEAKAEKAKPDKLEFLNGDVLSGRLITLTPESLVWSHGDVETDIQFAPKNVRDIGLHTPVPVAAAADEVTVGLTNGDTLRGKVVEMGADTLVLDTTYAGQLTVRSKMVASMRPSKPVGEVFYSGPNSMEEWVRGNNQDAWEFRNGALYSRQGNGSIGKDVKLPDRARIDFDLAWQGQAYLTVSLFSEQLESYYGPGYQLSLQGNYVSLNRRTKGSSNGLGGHHAPVLSSKRKAEVSIRVDRKGKTVALLMDGTMVHQWQDPVGLDAGGGGIVFYVNRNLHRIRNLRVLPWDGKIEQASDREEEEEAASAEDQVQFANGDKVTGELLSIKNNEVTVKSPYAELKIPLERIVLISFREEDRERARRNAGDVQGVFRNGGQATMALTELKGGVLRGESENFGKAEFQIGAFASLRVNIYDERQEAKEDEDEDW
jgi:hypothetical protein